MQSCASIAQGAHSVVAKDGDAMAKTEAEVREIANRLMQEIDFRANEARARGERFEQLDEPTLMRKLTGEVAHSPFFTTLSWSSGPPGGTITFTAFIHNPDPTSYSGFALFGYLLFGPANFVQATDDANRQSTADQTFLTKVFAWMFIGLAITRFKHRGAVPGVLRTQGRATGRRRAPATRDRSRRKPRRGRRARNPTERALRSRP